MDNTKQAWPVTCKRQIREKERVCWEEGGWGEREEQHLTINNPGAHTSQPGDAHAPCIRSVSHAHSLSLILCGSIVLKSSSPRTHTVPGSARRHRRDDLLLPTVHGLLWPLPPVSALDT